MEKILQTDRLYLREWTVEDAPEMFRIHSDPQTMRFVTPPGSLEVERASIERHIQTYYRQLGYGIWATVLKDGDRLIGRCGLVNQTVEDRDEMELTYLIEREFWNRGLTTEAARAIRDHAFNQLKTNRLISLIHPQNAASRRVAEKTGMHLERTIQWKHWGNVMVFAIESEE
jgi:[ribosomal protein S5]-alanine N-acetyltransferase